MYSSMTYDLARRPGNSRYEKPLPENCLVKHLTDAGRKTMCYI